MRKVNNNPRRLYLIWYGMTLRCSTRAKGAEKKNYYNRGIRVCEDWKDYKSFEKWADSSGYDKSLQIDRINNDGNYCPQNCRWVTHQANSQNRRTSKLTVDEALLLKIKLKLGISQKCLRGMMGFSSAFLSRVKSGKRWGNIIIAPDLSCAEIK